jgi:hypothetical protein
VDPFHFSRVECRSGRHIGGTQPHAVFVTLSTVEDRAACLRLEFSMRLDVHHHFPTSECSSCAHTLHRIERSIMKLEQRLMDKLAELEAAVAENTSVDQSAVALIEGLASQIEQAGVDQTRLAELVANLRGSSGSLAAAVGANTPTPTPTPEETVPGGDAPV